MNEVLALSGLSGTGKSTLAGHLETEHGFTLLEGSVRLKEVAAKSGRMLNTRD